MKINKWIEPAAAGLQPLSMWHHAMADAKKQHGEMMFKEHIVDQNTTQASQVHPFFLKMREGKGLLQMPL